MKLLDQSATLVTITPDALGLIERAGRVCYRSEPNGHPEDFVRRLIKNGHHSVLEHASATLELVTDRGVTHELVRHRLASFSQESSRYCNYGSERFGNEIAVIPPIGLREHYNAWTLWQVACYDAEAAYFNLLSHGEKPEIARAVLPTCLAARIVVTANLREWRHILALRLSPKAHPQMRDLMEKVAALLVNECSVVFSEVRK